MSFLSMYRNRECMIDYLSKHPKLWEKYASYTGMIDFEEIYYDNKKTVNANTCTVENDIWSRMSVNNRKITCFVRKKILAIITISLLLAIIIIMLVGIFDWLSIATDKHKTWIFMVLVLCLVDIVYFYQRYLMCRTVKYRGKEFKLKRVMAGVVIKPRIVLLQRIKVVEKRIIIIVNLFITFIGYNMFISSFSLHDYEETIKLAMIFAILFF